MSVRFWNALECFLIVTVVLLCIGWILPKILAYLVAIVIIAIWAVLLLTGSSLEGRSE